MYMHYKLLMLGFSILCKREEKSLSQNPRNTLTVIYFFFVLEHDKLWRSLCTRVSCSTVCYVLYLADCSLQLVTLAIYEQKLQVVAPIARLIVAQEVVGRAGLVEKGIAGMDNSTCENFMDNEGTVLIPQM